MKQLRLGLNTSQEPITLPEVQRAGPDLPAISPTGSSVRRVWPRRFLAEAIGLGIWVRLRNGGPKGPSTSGWLLGGEKGSKYLLKRYLDPLGFGILPEGWTIWCVASACCWSFVLPACLLLNYSHFGFPFLVYPQSASFFLPGSDFGLPLSGLLALGLSCFQPWQPREKDESRRESSLGPNWASNAEGRVRCLMRLVDGRNPFAAQRSLRYDSEQWCLRGFRTIQTLLVGT